MLNHIFILFRYYDIILKQRSINEIGTQQLLLDTYNLKTLMLQLDNIGLTLDSNERSQLPSQSYIRLVNLRISKIEMILKLISTPEEILLERFKTMWSDGSVQDLISIMSLKSMRKQDQQLLLESFTGNLNPVDSKANSGEISQSNNNAQRRSSISSLTSMFQSSSVRLNFGNKN